MAYLEQFSRKKKKQGKSTVLTARLPSNLYDDLKDYTDELGLSISEAIHLLVEKEIRDWKNQNEATESKKNTKVNTNNNTMNTDDNSKFVVKEFDTVRKVSTPRIQSNTRRFTTKQWEVVGQLPCPLCKGWYSASNFSRHLKTQHDSIVTTQDVFTDEKHLTIVNDMIQERTGTPTK